MIRLFLILCFALSAVSFAQETHLDAALKSYQSADYETAKKLLDEDLAKDSNNTLILYNLGLAEYKIGNPGRALGYWRKALQINPGFQQAEEAVNYAKSQLHFARPENVSTFSLLLTWTENNIPTFILFFAGLLFLFLTCFACLRYWGNKRKALYNDTSLPRFPMSSLAYGCLAVLFLTPVIHSYRLHRYEKATVILKSSEVKTGPNTENATLFSLSEGEEVILLDNSDSWYKIKDGVGRLGWLSSESFFKTSER